MATTTGTPAVIDTSLSMRTQVRGTIPRIKFVPFICLVKSLCPEVGNLADFREWDRVYTLPIELKSPRTTVRLRQHQVLHGITQTHPAAKDHWPAWSLIYAGLPDRRVPPPCEKRPVATVAVGKEAEALLTLLGCKFAYEYVRKGLRHRTREGLTVDVYIVERLAKPGDPASSKPIVSGDDQCCVVEVSSDSTAPNTHEHIMAFMQYLHPYVSIDAQAAKPRRFVRT